MKLDTTIGVDDEINYSKFHGSGSRDVGFLEVRKSLFLIGKRSRP
jgi:hypothetical protein